MATIASNLHSTNSRLIVSKSDAGLANGFNRLRAAWTQYRTYRETLNALEGLSDRALSDLNFERGDLAKIAHREVYGH